MARAVTIVIACGTPLSALTDDRSGQEPLTPLAREGQQIYLTGTSTDGSAITAQFGSGADRVAADGRLFPCLKCHGHDGRGRPEGGQVPSDISRPALSRPYAVGRKGRREHGPYNTDTLIRAIAKGIDSSGNALSVDMPRYRMSAPIQQALAAYLLTLGTVADPGLAPQKIRLGVVLPPEGLLDGMGQAVHLAAEAYVQWLNEQGGLFGRVLEVDYLRPPEDPSERLRVVREFLSEGDILTLVASHAGGVEAGMASLAEQIRIPIIGLLTAPGVHRETGRYVFHVLPDLSLQGQALLQVARDQVNGPTRAVIVFSDTGRHDTGRHDTGRHKRVAQRITAAVQQSGVRPWDSLTAVELPSRGAALGRMVEDLRDTDTAAVMFLGSQAQAEALLAATQKADWSPLLLLSGPLIGASLLGKIADPRQVLLAFPTAPSRSETSARHLHLARSASLPKRYLGAQVFTLHALESLAQGLRLAGRNVTREALVDALESFDGYRSGFAPALTFGPYRREGASGSFVVSFASDGPKARWVSLR